MTFSYPVYGPARSVTRMYACTCGAHIKVVECTEDGKLSGARDVAIEAFRKQHESCQAPAAVEAP